MPVSAARVHSRDRFAIIRIYVAAGRRKALDLALGMRGLTTLICARKAENG